MGAGDMEVRMAHLEGAYEQINERLGTLDEDIRGLRNDLVDIRTDAKDLRKELLSHMNRQFFWLLGLLLVSIFLPFAHTVGR